MGRKNSLPLYWIKNAAYLTGVPPYAALIRWMARRAKDDRALLDVTKRTRFRGFSLRAYQVDEEILALLEELRAKNCERVLEVGTARGGTLFLLLNTLPTTARVVSVDLPSGEFGGGYPHWKIPLFRALKRKDQRLTLLRGDSQTVDMRKRVEGELGGPADFILIDGDHSYEGAKRDFEIYRELVRPGGMIAFHDIVPGSEAKVGGVPRLWEELKPQFQHRELVRDWGQGGYGIGVLYF